MKYRAFFAAAVVVCSLVLPQALAADERDDLKKVQDQLLDVELQVERLKAFLPPTDPAATRTFIETVATKAELKTSSIQLSAPERVKLANGHAAPVEVLHVDVRGADDPDHLLWFLRLTDLGARPILVESLAVDAEPAGGVRYELRLAAGSFSPVDHPSEDHAGVVAQQRQRLEDERLFLDLLTRIVPTRNGSGISTALATFTRAAEHEAVTVSRVRFSKRLSIEGVVAGAAARSALRDAIVQSLDAATLDLPDDGACRAFAAEGDLKQPTDMDELVAASAVFDAMASANCGGGQQPATAKIVARGTAPSAINLRMRSVDVSDLALALHDATGEGFVVDAGVDSRLDADIENATLEETVAAMKAAGLAVGPGPLHRISRSAGEPPKEQKFAGDPVSVALRHADARDVFCLFSQISGLEIDVPAKLEARVSIFAKDMEWDRVLDGFIEAAGLHYRISGHRVLLGAKGKEIQESAVVDACKANAEIRADRFATFNIEKLGASDLQLAGIARLKDGWQAYVAGPDGRVLPVGSGQKLFDATAKSVDASGVTITTNDSRELRLTLKP